MKTLKTPVKNFAENRVKEFLLKNRERYNILNIVKNQNKLIVFFNSNKVTPEQLNIIKEEISRDILLMLMDYVGKDKELSNLPLISYIVNSKARTILIEI